MADLESGALRHATSLAPQIGDKVRCTACDDVEGVVTGLATESDKRRREYDGMVAVLGYHARDDDYEGETVKSLFPRRHFHGVYEGEFQVIARAAYYDPSTEVAVVIKREDAAWLERALDRVDFSLAAFRGRALAVFAVLAALRASLSGTRAASLTIPQPHAEGEPDA